MATTQRATVEPSEASQGDSASETLARARSDDLVIALVGHIGAGIDDVRAQLSEEFRQAKYNPTVIRISDHIAELATAMAFPKAFPNANLSASRQIESVVARQHAGTWLRQQLDDDITASLAVRAIRDARRTPPPAGYKRVFLVDSLKHPREVELFTKRFSSSCLGRSF